jgi:hypothetical protein
MQRASAAGLVGEGVRTTFSSFVPAEKRGREGNRGDNCDKNDNNNRFAS